MEEETIGCDAVLVAGSSGGSIASHNRLFVSPDRPALTSFGDLVTKSSRRFQVCVGAMEEETIGCDAVLVAGSSGGSIASHNRLFVSPDRPALTSFGDLVTKSSRRFQVCVGAMEEETIGCDAVLVAGSSGGSIASHNRLFVSPDRPALTSFGDLVTKSSRRFQVCVGAMEEETIGCDAVLVAGSSGGSIASHNRLFVSPDRPALTSFGDLVTKSSR